VLNSVRIPERNPALLHPEQNINIRLFFSMAAHFLSDYFPRLGVLSHAHKPGVPQMMGSMNRALIFCSSIQEPVLRQSLLEGNSSICGVMLTANWRNEVERVEYRVSADRWRSLRRRTAERDWLYDGRPVLHAMHRLVIPSKVLSEVRRAESLLGVRNRCAPACL
jgi:hypothetical protein